MQILFWREGVARMAENTWRLLRLAGEEPTFQNIARIVGSLPRSVNDLNSPGWKADFCYRCLQQAHRNDPDAAKPLCNYFFWYFEAPDCLRMMIDTFFGIAEGMAERSLRDSAETNKESNP